MKKQRLTAVILAVCMLFSAMPHTVAADEISPITNVKMCKSWDLVRSRYITYTINGMECDSREMGTSFNLNAYNLMTESDKASVAKWMVNAGYSGRVRQFGESGAEVLMDKYNTDTGWKALWEQFKKNIETSYCSELIPYYGDPSISPSKNYSTTLDELLEFPEETDAYKILHDNKYYYSFEAREFIAERDAIELLMQDGRECYKILAGSMLSATQAAVKGSSKELISLICDKALVPAITPTSSISSTAKDIFSAGLELTDRITGYSGQLQDAVIGKMTDGAAAKSQITYFRQIADANKELARYYYNQSLALHNKMLSDAHDIVEAVDKAEAHRVENGRDGEVEQENKKNEEHTASVSVRYSNVGTNTGAFSGIDKDNYDAQVRARENLSKSIQSWADKKVAQAEPILKAAGFCPVTSQEERDSVDTEKYVGTYFVEETDGKRTINNAMLLDPPESDALDALDINPSSGYSSSAFDRFYTADGIAELEIEKNRLVDFYERRIAALSYLQTQYETFENDFISEEIALIAKGKGFDKYFDTNYCYKYITYHYITTNDTSRAAWAKSCLSFYKNTLWSAEDSINDINRNFQWYQEKYQAKADRDKQFADYTKDMGKEMLELWEKYGSAAAKEQDLLNKGMPGYVYGDTVKLYADDDGTFDPAAASPAQYKAEAKNLAAAYDKYTRYDAELEQAEAAFRSAYAQVDRWRLNHGDAPVFGDDYEAVSQASNKYLDVRYNGDYDITAEQAANAEKTRKLWQDFDGMSAQNVSLKNDIETVKSRVGSYKRQIKMGFMTQSGYDYLKNFYNEKCDYVEKSTNMGPYMVSADCKETTDLRGMLNAAFDELKAVLDDPSSYEPVYSVAKAEEPAGGVDAMLDKGASVQLGVVISPANATDQRINWTSSDPSVAVVDENGVVTAVSGGTAVIRAEAADCTKSNTASYSGVSYDVYTCDDRYAAEFNITVDGGVAFLYGDATADGILAADDAAAVLQKVLVDKYELPIQKKTDNWLKYVDATADGILAADDATAILQKVLMDSYSMPCEKK